MDVICWGSITQLNDRCWIVITACAFNVRVETSSLHSSSIMIIITIHHEKSWNSHDVLTLSKPVTNLNKHKFRMIDHRS